MSPWRNRLARSAVNRKVGGSSPPGDVVAFDEVEREPNFDLWLSGVGTLLKVMCWKIHIPVRTPKWLPRLIFCRGMSRPVNWYRDYVIKACDTYDMTCEQVNR